MNSFGKKIVPALTEISEILGRNVVLYDMQGLQMDASEKIAADPRIVQFIHLSANTDCSLTTVDEAGGLAVLCVDSEFVGVLSVPDLSVTEADQLRIAKRLAELIFKDRFKDSANRQELIKEWIFSNHAGDDSTFETRMSVAGISLDGYNIVAVLRALTQELNSASMQEREQLRRALPHYTDRLENLVEYLIIEDKFIFLFHSKDDLTVQRNLQELKKLLECNYPVCMCGGIGQPCKNYTLLGHSYEQADKSCCISQKSRQTQIMRYDELSIDLLVEEIPPQIKADFVNKVFGGCKKNDVDEWKVLLRAFFVSNGSISKVSEELFIHKNTLQYKLNKIRKQTGYDPRNTCDALKLYLAILFSSNLRY